MAAFLVGEPLFQGLGKGVLVIGNFPNAIGADELVGVVPQAQSRNSVETGMDEGVGYPLELRLRGEHEEPSLPEEVRNTAEGDRSCVRKVWELCALPQDGVQQLWVGSRPCHEERNSQVA